MFLSEDQLSWNVTNMSQSVTIITIFWLWDCEGGWRGWINSFLRNLMQITLKIAVNITNEVNSQILQYRRLPSPEWLICFSKLVFPEVFDKCVVQCCDKFVAKYWQVYKHSKSLHLSHLLVLNHYFNSFGWVWVFYE